MIEAAFVSVMGGVSLLLALDRMARLLRGRPRRLTAPVLVVDEMTERLREEQAQHEAELAEFDRELRPALATPPLGTSITDLWKQVYLNGQAAVLYEADLRGAVEEASNKPGVVFGRRVRG